MEYVEEVLKSDVSQSSLLRQFSDALAAECPIKSKSSEVCCLSRSLIPMTFTENQKMVMKMSSEVRLAVEDGVSCLIPEEHAVCKHCVRDSCSWSSPVLVRQCRVIMEKEIFKAKGTQCCKYMHVYETCMYILTFGICPLRYTLLIRMIGW